MTDVAGIDGVLSHQREAGVPYTQAATSVSEAGAHDFCIEKGKTPRAHTESLHDRGLRGWHLMADRRPEPLVVERLLSGPLALALQAADEYRRYFSLTARRGTVFVRTDGYLTEPDELDWLAQVLAIAARELREACRL